MKKYFPIESDNGFQFFIAQPVYKYVNCGRYCYIRNTKTGENIGQELILAEFKYNSDGSINENPEKEEDCYEIVSLLERT